MTDFPKDGSSFVVESIDRTEYRWAKYKPQGAKQMGKPGRWQKRVWHGDFFKWENCDEPSGEIASLSEDGPISAAFRGHASLLSEYERATARSEALEAENKMLREALEKARSFVEQFAATSAREDQAKAAHEWLAALEASHANS